MKVNTWPLDGKSHSKISEADIFKTRKIETFLENDSRQILVAAKGMGKTLLLRVKKKIIVDGNTGELIIPQNREYDEPKFTGTLSSKNIISSLESWRSLWEVCITLSILSYSDSFLKKSNFEEEIDQMVDNLGLSISVSDYIKKGIFKTQKVDPSYFLNKFITELSIQKLEQFLRRTSEIYRVSNNFINSSVCIFIDAFDQTLSDNFKDNLEVWKNGQLGLIKAVHKLHTYNPHIKIYTSIRQEAFSGFIDEQRSAIKGLCTLLEYTKNDLNSIFELSITQFTKYKNIEEFTGFTKIRNSFIKKDELIFDYIYRHSTYTPRSIMKFGREIDELSEKSEINFKELINKVGAENIIDDYLSTEKVFLMTYLKTQKIIYSLLKSIPSNVINGKMIEEIKNKFARENGFLEEDCHPFCELYNIGLLGTIKKSEVTAQGYTQNFKKPHEYDWQHFHITGNNESDIYLVHPSLYHSIINKRGTYLINNNIVIGDGNYWNDDLELFPSIFLSHSPNDKKILIDNFVNRFEKRISSIFPVRVLLDINKTKTVDDVGRKVEDDIKKSDIVLFCISQSSLASGWVEAEWRINHYNAKDGVIPFILDDINIEKIPDCLQTRKIQILYDNNWEKAIEDLAKDIAEKLAPKLK